MIQYKVCGSCSNYLLSCDGSHLDESDLPGIDASVEAMGNVALTGEIGNGYFRCFVCGCDDISGYVFEGPDNY